MQIKQGNYEGAYVIYTEALEVDPDNVALNSKLYCNRALAASKVSCTVCLCMYVRTYVLYVIVISWRGE